MKTQVIYTVIVDYDRDPDEATEEYEVRDETANALTRAANISCPLEKANVVYVGVRIETKED